MNWEDTKAKMKHTEDLIAKTLIGKRIKSVKIGPISYPGHFNAVEILTEDNERLTVSGTSGRCPMCDPEGVFVEVNMEVVK